MSLNLGDSVIYLPPKYISGIKSYVGKLGVIMLLVILLLEITEDFYQ
jgi:hypothetical protein